MGIVDFQQLYDISKKVCQDGWRSSERLSLSHLLMMVCVAQAERFFKVHVKGDSAEGLSCIEPKAYRTR